MDGAIHVARKSLILKRQICMPDMDILRRIESGIEVAASAVAGSRRDWIALNVRQVSNASRIKVELPCFVEI